VDNEKRLEIVRSLIKTRSAYKTAKATGYDIRDILSVAEEENSPRSNREERFGGYGPPNMRDFMVARKKAWEAWKNSDPAIKKAREDYECGVVELATGRDGDWLILYAIPRLVITPRPGYFNPEF